MSERRRAPRRPALFVGPSFSAGIKVLAAATVLALLGNGALRTTTAAQAVGGVRRFEWPATGLVLERPSKSAAFLDVVGRRSAFFGYEHGGLEAWVAAGLPTESNESAEPAVGSAGR